MDSQTRSHIQEWLSETIEESRDTNTLPGAVPDVVLARTTIPQGFRTNDAAADLSIPDANIANRRRHSDIELGRRDYVRRARHKTKEDRYEYKGKGARAKDTSGSKKRKKTVNRIRKHTINDYFHASNVTANRLTLRRSLDMGIFNKGKASAPVKSRRVSEVFSEVNFLSRSTVSNRERLSTVQRRDTECLERQRTNYTSSNLVREKGIEKRCCFSPLENLTGNAQIEESTTESLEMYTKGLLYFDLSTRETSEVISKVGSSKKYWTLEDLKFLLEERIQSWHSSQEQRKCERLPSVESKATVPQQPSKTKNQSQEDQLEVIKTVKSRIGNATFTPSSIPQEIHNYVCEDLKRNGPCWSPKCNQECHGLMTFDQESTFPSKLAEPISHEQTGFYDGDECENYGTEMDWAYDRPVLNGMENDPVMDDYEDLVFHALDMIIDSDKGSLYETAGNGGLKLTDGSPVGDNETTGLIQQGCRRSWGNSNQACSLFPPSLEKFPQSINGLQEQFNGEFYAQDIGQYPYASKSPETRRCIRQPPTRQEERSGQQSAGAFNPEEELVHALKWFWRQNKLY